MPVKSTTTKHEAPAFFLCTDRSSRNANSKLTRPTSRLSLKLNSCTDWPTLFKERVVSLLDFFRTKPSVAVAPDRIWMTPEAKLNGLIAQVRDENRLVLVIAHFPATLANVEKGLSAAGLPSEFHDGRLSRKDIKQATGRKVLLVLAASLASNDMPLEISHTLDGLAILVAERHFLRAKDNAILSFARTLGRPSEVVFHLSLHDPLMKQFAGDWVENVLKRLGMDESERIDSSMVARRIKGAQAKLSSGVFSDRRADSAEEWLRFNVPGMGS